MSMSKESIHKMTPEQSTEKLLQCKDTAESTKEAVGPEKIRVLKDVPRIKQILKDNAERVKRIYEQRQSQL